MDSRLRFASSVSDCIDSDSNSFDVSDKYLPSVLHDAQLLEAAGLRAEVSPIHIVGGLGARWSLRFSILFPVVCNIVKTQTCSFFCAGA